LKALQSLQEKLSAVIVTMSLSVSVQCGLYILYLVQWNTLARFRFRNSFVCQGISTRKQRSDLSFQSSSQAATWYYQSNHSKVEAIPLSALPKNTTRELAGLSPH